MPVKDYHRDLLSRLADPDYAAHYLQAALAATLTDGDRAALVLALNNVAAAQGSARIAATEINGVHEAQLAEVEQINSLSVEMLLTVLDSVGLTLEFKSA